MNLPCANLEWAGSLSTVIAGKGHLTPPLNERVQNQSARAGGSFWICSSRGSASCSRYAVSVHEMVVYASIQRVRSTNTHWIPAGDISGVRRAGSGSPYLVAVWTMKGLVLLAWILVLRARAAPRSDGGLVHTYSPSWPGVDQARWTVRRDCTRVCNCIHVC